MVGKGRNVQKETGTCLKMQKTGLARRWERLNDSSQRNFNSSSQLATLSREVSNRSPTTNLKPPTPLMTCTRPTTWMSSNAFLKDKGTVLIPCPMTPSTSSTSPTTAGAQATAQLLTSEMSFCLITVTMTVTILERNINRMFKRQNPRKAAGPDSVPPSTLKHYAGDLSLEFPCICNMTETYHVPACLKISIIIPNPKKPRTSGINDDRPAALTSVVMKSFVLSHLKAMNDPLLDPLQFVYRANRSVDDTVNMALHLILQQGSLGTYARILFNLGSTFNTIILALLQDKLSQLNVPDSTCRWMTGGRNLGKRVSYSMAISDGFPQGWVLSSLLFSLFINLSSLWSVRMTPPSLGSSLVGMSPLTGERLTVWWPDADKLSLSSTL